jgi:acetolactate synthase-1/2/3 large subunit
MGFGLPSALGAQVANPNQLVIAICGDGGFQMSIPELATLFNFGLPVKVIVMNNGYLGMVRQWQQFFYDGRYSATPLRSPDFVKLAEAHGLKGLRVTRREDVEAAVREAQASAETVLIDFRVEQEDSVYPMVPAGAALGEMIRRPSPIVETAADE